MERIGLKKRILVPGSILGLLIIGSVSLYGADSNSRGNIPEGVYIKLTRDFYEALKQDGYSGSRLYSNDLSTDYLKEISISARFMVETNLEILKQQERIIDLLQSALEKKK